MNKIRNSTHYVGCVHEDSQCNENVSKAHSIQKNRYLSKLAHEGEVVCIDFNKSFADEGKFKLVKVGINKASVFTGFCNYHDQNIFEPIENKEYNPDNITQNFLFAYRAFALGYYERHSAYNFKKKELELLETNRQIVRASQLRGSISSYENHLDITEKLRSRMNHYLDSCRFDRITTDVIVWNRNYGLAATSMFYILKDKLGKQINTPPNDISPFFLTIIPQNKNTFILMSCLSKSRARYDFIKKQIMNTHPDEQKIIVSNMLSMYVENFFISPVRWDAFPQTLRDQFIDIWQSNAGRDKHKLNYYSSFNLFA